MEQQEKPPKFLYLPEVKNDHFIIGGAPRCVRTGIRAGAGT